MRFVPLALLAAVVFGSVFLGAFLSKKYGKEKINKIKNKK